MFTLETEHPTPQGSEPSVETHRTLALGGRAVEPYTAMEGLLPAIRSTFQLVLEPLWGALLVISESWRHVAVLHEFPWEILAYIVILVVTAKKRHIWRSVKVLGKRCLAHAKVCGKGSGNMGPMTQADDALGLPGVEASLPTLQTLCFSAVSTNRCRLALQNTIDFLKMAQKTQPPNLSQVTGDRPILRTSEKNGKQLWKKIMDDLNGNTHVLESPELLAQEMARWKQRLQETEQEKERLEQSNAGMQRALKDKVSQLIPLGENLLKAIPWPCLLGDLLGHVNWEVKQKREAENDNHPIHRSEGDLKGVTDDADSNVSLQSAEEKNEELARQLWEEKRINEELMGQITDLRAKEASLQRENSQLQSEIQQLKRKLQILPQLYQEYTRELERKSLEKEAQCSDIEKSLSYTCGNIESATQIRNFYKKMAEDTRRELEENTSHYLKDILFYANKVQESWMAAVLTERKVKELRKENDHIRQMLAKAEFNFPPFPSGPFAPAPPRAAHGGPEVSGDPLDPQHPQEGEEPGREGPRIQGHLQV